MRTADQLDTEGHASWISVGWQANCRKADDVDPVDEASDGIADGAGIGWLSGLVQQDTMVREGASREWGQHDVEVAAPASNHSSDPGSEFCNGTNELCRRCSLR